jgi:hypothetical protein
VGNDLRKEASFSDAGVTADERDGTTALLGSIE